MIIVLSILNPFSNTRKIALRSKML